MSAASGPSLVGWGGHSSAPKTCVWGLGGGGTGQVTSPRKGPWGLRGVTGVGLGHWCERREGQPAGGGVSRDVPGRPEMIPDDLNHPAHRSVGCFTTDYRDPPPFPPSPTDGPPAVRRATVGRLGKALDRWPRGVGATPPPAIGIGA